MLRKRNALTIAEYREANPCCEIAGWWHQVAIHERHGRALADCERTRDQIDGEWLDCPVVHHILGGTGNRYDVPCNLLRVCGFAHAWIHDDVIAGRIVCWRIKLSKHGFDPEAIEEFSRQHPAGWLTMDKTLERCAMSDQLELWRCEVLEACD